MRILRKINFASSLHFQSLFFSLSFNYDFAVSHLFAVSQCLLFCHAIYDCVFKRESSGQKAVYTAVCKFDKCFHEMPLGGHTPNILFIYSNF